MSANLNWLAYHIIKNNPEGIRESDAVQLFRILYCVSSVLPESCRNNRLDIDTIISTFGILESEGKIRYDGTCNEILCDKATDWAEVHEAFRTGRLKTNLNFLDRARQILADR